MTIYRLQKDGVGPYQGASWEGGVRGAMARKHSDDFHPTTDDDGLSMKEFHYSACSSLPKLKEWFRGFLKSLLRLKYEVVAIEIDPQYILTGASGRQVIYDRRQVKSTRIVRRLY